MTLPAQDIVSRLDAVEACSDRPYAAGVAADAKGLISRLTADNEVLRKDNARLSEEKEALAFGMRHGQSLSEDAIHAIRDLLNEADVPLAAFIDDHVGNAIVQRNQERAKVTALEAEVGRLREALEHCRRLSGIDNALASASTIVTARMAEIHQRSDAALANEEAGR